MAGAATAAYSAEALTSPASLNGSQQQWDFAVPIGPENHPSTTKSRASNDSSTAYQKSSRHPSSNGVTLSRSSSQRSKQRRDTSQTRAGRDGDGSLDSYARDSASRSAVNVMESAENHHNPPAKKGDSIRDSARQRRDENDPDSIHWIHRDKLAKIESEELQQAAIRFQRQVRAGSKSSSRRGRSHDSHGNGMNGSIVTTPPATEHTEQWPNLREEKRRPLDSLEDDENEPPEEERMNWDLRRPEEIAADQSAEFYEEGASKMYRNPGLRKSSSRIPVLATSPLPISQEHLEREFPSLRRRTLGSGDEESISYAKSRRASESAVIDTPEASPIIDAFTTPPMGSRPGSRGAPVQSSPAKKTPAKTTPGSGARKTSAPPPTSRKTTQQKPRATSGSSTRPTTRSGENRPTTAVNRPEGDPPWLATMYKPDPRLPPDQQILPTHARRMQQEQWEKEGKTPSAYDREFAPLAIRPDEPQRVSPESEKSQEAETPPWPFKSPKSPEPNTLSRTPTNGTGYSTMPKVRNAPPIAPSPKVNQPAPAPTPAPEPAEKEKGCGCCIVM